jgi:hypothetical protein
MGKMHELLAVEGDLKGAAEKILEETKKTFKKKEEYYLTTHRSYQPLDEEGEQLPDEDKNMVTTVEDKLKHTRNVTAKYIDAVLSKETTNQLARADVVLNGEKFLENMPATALLALEGKLKQLRLVLEVMPTLNPTERWEWDTETGTYKAAPKTTRKTQKVYRRFVKYEATEHQPAQVDVYTEDVKIGDWTLNQWSGMITAAEKSDMIAQCDLLTQAVKRARQRANEQEVLEIREARKIWDFLMEPLKK